MNSSSKSDIQTAVIYARYSSHAQREVSIEQQIRECTQYAERNNLKVIAIYSDRAISGKTDHRPQFQKMMNEAAAGKFRYVIAWKSNRMGRNMMQAMVNEARLNELGVRCLYVEEDFDDTAAGRFALRNMMNVNQFYSDNLAEDVRRGLMDNASKCMVNCPCPLGLKKGEDGRFAIDEEGAKIVREIYERVNAGDLFVDIANDLNARGIKTSRGNLWKKSSFHYLISNEQYIGTYSYGGIRIDGGIPPVLQKELFYAVQEKLKNKKATKRRHTDNADYLLTGKLFCGKCESPMVGCCGTGKSGTKYFYYACQKKRVERACDKKNVQKDYIEQRVTEAVREYLLDDDVITWIADGYQAFLDTHRRDSALTAMQDELADVEKSLKNIMAAIEQGIFTSTTRERLLELETLKQSLKASIAVAEASLQEVPRERIEFWIHSFREGDANNKEYQAKLIDSFVQAVYLYDDSLRIVCNYTGKDNEITITLADTDAVISGEVDVCSLKVWKGVPYGQRSKFGTQILTFFHIYSPSNPAIFLGLSTFAQKSFLYNSEPA